MSSEKVDFALLDLDLQEVGRLIEQKNQEGLVEAGTLLDQVTITVAAIVSSERKRHYRQRVKDYETKRNRVLLLHREHKGQDEDEPDTVDILQKTLVTLVDTEKTADRTMQNLQKQKEQTSAMHGKLKQANSGLSAASRSIFKLNKLVPFT